MGGHGIAIGGAVVDGGNFDWGKDDRFPTIAGPHYAMNEINFFEEFGPAAFTAKFRAEGMYILAPRCRRPMPFTFCRVLKRCRFACRSIWTIPRRCWNSWVATTRSPGAASDLPDHPSHELVKTMLPRGAGSIIVFGLKGGRDAGKAFIEAVELSSHLANVGDAKTLVIHPASTTHSHISAEAMVEGGLSDDMIRLSVGLEDIADITADFEIGFRRCAHRGKGCGITLPARRAR